MPYALMPYALITYEANSYRNILCCINKPVLRPTITNRVLKT
jgi:hypothetical protein